MDGDGVVLGLQATIMLARQIRVNTAILGRIVPYMITGLLRQDHLRGQFFLNVQPISRVLSDKYFIRTVIPLGVRLLGPSSSLPTVSWSGRNHPSPPIRPCSSRGLPCHMCYHMCGELLPRRFTLA